MLFSIGHSNHSLPRFQELLDLHKVMVVVDVRSAPASRRWPRFNKATLAVELPAAGRQYVLMGDQLGGRPSDPSLYDIEGRARYDLLAETPAFRAGLDRIIRGARQRRLALFCSEEDPSACHRQLLIGRVLANEGHELFHIRGDGRLESNLALAPPGEQLTLFEANPSMQSSWTSPVRLAGWKSGHHVAL